MNRQSNTRTIIALLLIAGCMLVPYLRKNNSSANYIISGFTMGTSYTVKMVGLKLSDERLKQIKLEIENTLKLINKQMSTFDKTSEISVFNNIDSGIPFKISSDFLNVVELSKRVYSATSGAFDPTVSPLIDAWGFGPKKTVGFPEKVEIEKSLAKVGYEYIVFDDQILTKKIAGVELNLSAIAKGYGVDKIVSVIGKTSCVNYMVEIGGEVRTVGVNQSGADWRIGIQNPEFSSNFGDVNIMVIKLPEKSIATSGDYRNFFEYRGKKYSHVIDPETGYPTETGVASASVIANSCAEADAFATALMVMGVHNGLNVIEAQDAVEAMITVRNKSGLTNYKSSGFDNYVLK